MLKKMLLSASLAVFCVSAHASNLSFLGDSILSDLDKEDVVELKASIRNTLGSTKDKQTMEWSNKAGDIRIDITPKLTYNQGDTTCRRTEFFLREHTRQSERYHFEVCNTSDGWKVSPSPIKSFSQTDLQLFAAQLYDVLENGKSAIPSSWVNPSSKNSAVIVPLESIESGSRTCRKASISIMDKQGKTADGLYIFCQRQDGKWRRP